MKATYTKLEDGSWGIRVKDGMPRTGDMIAVQKRSGEQKLEKVGKLTKAYPDNDGKGNISIFTIANTKYPQKRFCSCTDTCCKNKCFCERSCNCRGGNIYDC